MNQAGKTAGGKAAKPASSFGGRPSSDRANGARGGHGASSNGGGGPHERGRDVGGVEGVEVAAAVEVDNKELMHVLESTLITWTKQIKNVLKQVGFGQGFEGRAPSTCPRF